MRFRFDVEENEALQAAASNPLAAGRCLDLFAKRLRAEQVDGDRLLDYIASAFEAAVKAAASERASVLTRALNLSASRKRPAGDWLEIGELAERMITEDRITQEKTFGFLAEKYGIDESTARNYRNQYVTAREAHTIAGLEPQGE